MTQKNENTVLSVEQVSKSFYVEDEPPIIALSETDLEVQKGEFVAVIGPSGCGKSTLFNIIGGLIPSDTGQIVVEGKKTNGPDKQIGMVFQEESTFAWRTVEENISFPLELAGVPKQERMKQAAHFADLVGLSGFEKRYPAELSGGMRQSVALARTLALEPQILLMDEPFAALDEQTRMLLGEKITEIREALDQTVLLITHNITEAVQLSDRVAIMSFRPGMIKRILDIDLPRPRGPETISSEKFGHYVGEIWADLREEAARGLLESEKARADEH